MLRRCLVITFVLWNNAVGSGLTAVGQISNNFLDLAAMSSKNNKLDIAAGEPHLCTLSRMTNRGILVQLL
jgi:hypothetical protein